MRVHRWFFQARPKTPNQKRNKLAWSRDLWTVGAHAIEVSQVLCGCIPFLVLGAEATCFNRLCQHQLTRMPLATRIKSKIKLLRNVARCGAILAFQLPMQVTGHEEVVAYVC